MTGRPTGATVGGRAYLDLRKAASVAGRPTDEFLQLYALEGFLDRLGSSPHAEHFVLKGGVLLAAYDARRPTRDIDLAGPDVANDLDNLLRGSWLPPDTAGAATNDRMPRPLRSM